MPTTGTHILGINQDTGRCRVQSHLHQIQMYSAIQMTNSMVRTRRNLHRIKDPTIEPRRTRTNPAIKDIIKEMDEHNRTIEPWTPSQQHLPWNAKIKVDKIFASSSIKFSKSDMEESNWKWIIHDMARTYSRSSGEISATPFASNRQRAYESTKERHQIGNEENRIHICAS